MIRQVGGGGGTSNTSNQFIDREEIKRRLRETKAEKKSRQQISGVRIKNNYPPNDKDKSEMFRLMIESGCYNTQNQGTIESIREKLNADKDKERALFSPDTEVHY